MHLKIVAQPSSSLSTPHVTHIDFGPDQSQYILSQDGKRLTIKLGNEHGVADGKQFHSFLLSTRTNSDLKAKLQGIETLEIEVGTGNPQFIYFYTVFPPGLFPSPFQKDDGSFPTIHVYYVGDKKSLEMFHTLTTSDARGIDFFTSWMGKESKALVPEGTKEYLLTYLTEMKTRFLKPCFNPLCATVETTFKALQEKINQRVSEFRGSEKPTKDGVDIKPRQERPTLRAKSPNFLTVQSLDESSGLSTQLSVDSVSSLHVESDQVTHVFSGDNARFIIDDGHPHTEEYLLNHDKDTNVFMLTHFHDDHVTYLTRDIEGSCSEKVTHLVIHEGCEEQFIGYLLSHPNLVDLIEKKKLTFEVLKRDSKGLEIDNQVVFPYTPSAQLKHFIHSAGFTVYDKSKNKIRLYTGDINPQLTDKTQAFKAAFIEDCKEILKMAKEKGVRQVDIYYDQGHFPEGTMRAADIKEQLISTRVDSGVVTLNMYPEHCKDATGVSEIKPAHTTIYE